MRSRLRLANISDSCSALLRASSMSAALTIRMAAACSLPSCTVSRTMAVYASQLAAVGVVLRISPMTGPYASPTSAIRVTGSTGRPSENSLQTPLYRLPRAPLPKSSGESLRTTSPTISGLISMEPITDCLAAFSVCSFTTPASAPLRRGCAGYALRVFLSNRRSKARC